MGFFAKQRQMKKEAEETVRRWEEEAARKEQQIRQEFKKPINPLTIEVKNTTYRLINGFYDAWCTDGNLVLESTLPGNLTLTLREDWNSETISKLGFDSPSYRLEQLDPMDKRKYTICFEDDRARFVTIPVSNIISITETGDLTAVNAVTEIKFKTSKRADVKNKTITTDTRMGIVRIADSVHGDYDITISYSQFQQFCAMIEAYRKQNSKNEKTMEDTKSLTETLKEMKELLDLGIITEEEFAKKKEELLSRI